MTQLDLIDPRSTASVTQAMHDDAHLKGAIEFVRTWHPGEMRAGEPEWPYVEALLEIGGRMAWAVDDRGDRYVVVGGTVWRRDDLDAAAPALRSAARAAFDRLDRMAA